MSQGNKALQAVWRKRLNRELPHCDRQKCQSILTWLLSDQAKQPSTPHEIATVNERLNYRYRILCQRYLDASSHESYRHLIARLSALIIGIPAVKMWVAKHANAQREVMQLIRQIIQDIVDNDPYVQQRINAIAQYTSDSQLRQALLMASLEEYCMHPLQNQPLLMHRLRQSLRHQLQTATLQAA